MIPKDAINRLQAAFGLKKDRPMNALTTFRVGGPADLLARPETRDELIALLGAAKAEGIPVTFIGGGSNLLVGDSGIRGLVVMLTKFKSGIRKERISPGETRMVMAAGERLSSALAFANANGLSGLEFCAGIPGTVGGAVMMNAGTAGQGICDRVECLKVLDLETLAIETIGRQNLKFSYRCLEMPGKLILSVALTLLPSDPETVASTFEKHLKRKHATQPVAMASAGCFFKNPAPDKPAGRLIQDCGLKGAAVNDAVVSDLHANYIVNRGNATCRDILTLKTRIQQAVSDRYGIQLQTEIKVTGDE